MPEDNPKPSDLPAESETPGQVASDLAKSNNAFALDLYDHLKSQKGNLFFSPFSISVALAMAFAGAGGETAAQFARVLHYPDKANRSPSSCFEFFRSLQTQSEKNDCRLDLANAFWGQSGYRFFPNFIETLRTRFGSELHEVDFTGSPAETVCEKINQWVETQTQEKIKDLIRPNMIDPALTRLILVNAIYFKADWSSPFESDMTQPMPFHGPGLQGEKAEAPMMVQTEDFKYMEDDAIQALELPYTGGGLGMCILLPKKVDGIDALEQSLNSENLSAWFSRMRSRMVWVFLPKFELHAEFLLADTLKSLGLNDAFHLGKADFKGISDQEDFYLSEIVHKTFVDVYESGTEAAAATADVVLGSAMEEEADPIPVFRADHPFIFLIRDLTTDCILFLGRFSQPGQ